MIRHVFTLVWHRKRANLLVILEMAATFLVLFAVAGFGLHYYRLYRLPLGFEVDDTWTVSVSTGEPTGASLVGPWQEGDGARLEEIAGVLEGLREVRSVHYLQFSPFTDFSWRLSPRQWQGRVIQAGANWASGDLPEAIGMKLLEGRWFGRQDDGLDAIPAVINARLRDELFSGESVLGARLTLAPNQPPLEVVGVFEDFRSGEFSESGPYIFLRLDMDNDASRTFFGPPGLLLKLAGGVGLQFEEALLETLRRVGGDWEFEVMPWPQARESRLRDFAGIFLVAAVVVFSLLLMVGFGLLGVLWQNVIRRTGEIGLRRAMGAPAVAVRRQIVLELLAMASLALFLGFVVVIQLPLTGVIPALGWSLFIPSTIVSAGILLGFCVLFSLYPSFQATRRDPVEALRYE